MMSEPIRTAATCTTTVLVPTEVLLAYVSDPLNLPAWAPDFAATVSPSVDGTWMVASPEGERRIVVRASNDVGVVDFLSAADPQWGAFMRVLPSGTHSLVTFSLLFPGDAARDLVESAMRGATQELANLRQILEPSP
jgi:hypothetical protein